MLKGERKISIRNEHNRVRFNLIENWVFFYSAEIENPGGLHKYISNNNKNIMYKGVPYMRHI